MKLNSGWVKKSIFFFCVIFEKNIYLKKKKIIVINIVISEYIRSKNHIRNSKA